MATITSKGQITLPAALRKALDLATGDRIRIELGADERATISPVRRKDVTDFSGVFAGHAGPRDFAGQRRAGWQRRAKELERQSRA